MSDGSIVPRARTETDKIRSPISRCGDNWWKTVKVRSPYKGLNVAFRRLPPLGEPVQLEHMYSGFPEELMGDHARIVAFAEKNLDAMSDKQRSNVEMMLDRASRYVADAVRIQEAWHRGFATSRFGEVPSWPLGGKPSAQPNGAIEEGHARDSDAWKKLVRAALRNLRCAEEVVKKSTILRRNKQIWSERNGHGARFGVTVGGLSRLSAGDPDNIIVDEGEDIERGRISLDEGADDPAPPVDEPSEVAPTKKKDNTMMIVAAVGLGALILMKK
jgi:hypothetical protein